MSMKSKSACDVNKVKEFSLDLKVLEFLVVLCKVLH